MASSRKVICIAVLLWMTHIASNSITALAEPPAGAAPVGEAPVGEAPVGEAPEAKTQQESEVPPPRTHYKGREIAQTMHFDGAPWLIRNSRERQEECSTLMDILNVKPGQTVCDMGCGNGFYSLKLAEKVGPDGRILGVDIQREMLLLLEDRAKKAKIANVESILGDLHDPKLKENDVDLILCVDVYHEFSHPEHMLRKMRAALKPKGRIVLVEFRAEDPKVPIKKLHKMSKEQILLEWEPNGFKLVEEFDKLPWQHVMFFEQNEEWKEEVSGDR